MKKSSSTPRNISSHSSLHFSTRKKDLSSLQLQLNLNSSPKLSTIPLFKQRPQPQSCKSLNRPGSLKLSKSEIPCTVRSTPKSNSTPINRINPYEVPLLRPKAINSLIKLKRFTPKAVNKPVKTSMKELATQVNSGVYDVRSKGTSKNDIRKYQKDIHKAHLTQTVNGLRLINEFSPLDIAELGEKIMDLPRPKGYEGRKTVVFDLDETLVHCVESSKGDIEVEVNLAAGEKINVGINIRPFAVECLKEARKEFEVIVFTASHKCYADAVLDALDTDNSLIHYRLYREHCVIVGGMHIKDLRVIGGRNIEEIVIVDNAVHSFAFQIDNGIPIISWHNDKHDRELFKLVDYLKLLSSSPDIRKTNRETFHLRSLNKSQE